MKSRREPEPVLLGSLEEQVMLAVVRRGDDAYGMNVRRELEDVTNRDVAIGAVYATLDRLEAKGLVVSTRPGASEGPQACVLVGDGPGGLQPQPMASSPTAVTAASKRSIRMPRAYGHRAPGQKTILGLAGGHRLLAVDALHHRGVAMNQGTDGLAVADGEYVGVPSRLTTS